MHPPTFATPPLLPLKLSTRTSQNVRPTTRPRCTLPTPPTTYISLREQATAATQAAIRASIPLLEIQFPPVSNMATAALNELLDANRAFTRDFLLPFVPRHPKDTVIAVFPDLAEARLAANAYGKVPFALAAMPTKETPVYAREGADGIIAVVNPGFNVDEWINMEKLAGVKPLISLNADLDKVRGGYYPRLFYPKLHDAKTRFLSKFVAVYYVKQFSNGGTLLRCYPHPWTLFYRSSLSGKTEVVWTSEERPQFVMVERLLSEKRVADLLNR